MVVEKTSRLLLVGFALLVALLYDILFWGHLLGLGFTLFVLAYTVGFLLITVATKQLRNYWSLLLLIPVGIMSVDAILFNNTLVSNFVPLIVFALLLLFSVLSTLRNPYKHKFSFLKIQVISNALIVIRKMLDVKDDLLHIKQGGASSLPKKILVGILIAVPILFIFGMLFASADAVFSEWMNKIFDIEIDEISVWRVMRTTVLWAILSGFFYVLVEDKHSLQEKVTNIFKFDKTVTSIVLGLINALFLLFVFIQVKYLFGNVDFVLENGITFADYARNGFFELVWVMVFAAAILGLVYRAFSHHGESKMVNLLQIILIVQVGVIALSALKRMNLYQDAYGYTVLRLYVEWFIYMTLVLMTFGVGSLIWNLEFKKYAHISMIISLAALTVVASVNVDLMIANKNVDRYLERGDDDSVDIDLAYLSYSLSVDISPAIAKLENAQLEEQQEYILSKNIAYDLKELRVDRSILEYNLGREKAKKALEPLENAFKVQ